MDLAALVQVAIHAMPDGIQGTATFTRLTNPPLDFVNDDATGAIAQSFTAPFVSVNLRKNMWDSRSGVTRTLTEHRDVLVASKDCAFPIISGMTMTVGTDVWRIVGNDPVDPTLAAPVLYEFQITK